MTAPTPIFVSGHGHFSSIQKCAEYFGVAYTTVYYHLNNGTLDKIGLSGRPKNNCHPITVGGITYPSRTAYIRAAKLSHQEFYKRLNAGQPLPLPGEL